MKRPRLTRGQRRFLTRVLEYPRLHGRQYRPRGRFTKLTADRLVARELLREVEDYYAALYDPRTKAWIKR